VLSQSCSRSTSCETNMGLRISAPSKICQIQILEATFIVASQDTGREGSRNSVDLPFGWYGCMDGRWSC
jgi:hypothetical protein